MRRCGRDHSVVFFRAAEMRDLEDWGFGEGEIEGLDKEVLQADVAVCDAPLVQVAHAAHELLEEESSEAFLKGSLSLEHVAEVSSGGVLMDDAEHRVCEEYLHKPRLLAVHGVLFGGSVWGQHRHSQDFTLAGFGVPSRR